MSAPGTGNRAMFWRIIRRLLGANRGRLFVILLALSAGAAVTAALLNLQIDAKRRITTEFRAFGANVFLTPRDSDSNALRPGERTIDAAICKRIPRSNGYDVAAAELLYGVVQFHLGMSALRSQIRGAQCLLFWLVISCQEMTLAKYFRLRFSQSPRGEYSWEWSRVFVFPLASWASDWQSGWAFKSGSLWRSRLMVPMFCAISLSIRRFGGPEDGQILMWT